MCVNCQLYVGNSAGNSIMMIGEFLICLTGLVALIYVYIKKQLNFWSDLGFPKYAGASIPWRSATGSQARTSLIDIALNVYRNSPNEKFIGFWLMLRPTLLIRDPDLIKNVLVRDFNSFNDRGIYYNEKKDPISGHLIALAGAKWKNIRVKITPAFSSGKMKAMFPLITHCGVTLNNVVDRTIEKNPVVDLHGLLQRYTTDVISLIAFGLDTNSMENPNAPFRQFGIKIFNPNNWDKIRGLVNLVAPRISKLLNLRVFRKEITDYYVSAIRKTIEYREKNNVKRNDLVDILIELKNNGRLEDMDKQLKSSADEKKFEESDFVAQAFIFFAAGFETSSTTMTYVLYELAKHPDIQQRVREEILSVLKKYNGEVSYDAINEMKYLSMVLDETLRMYPVARLLSRVSTEDYPIPETNLVLPKGVKIIVNSYAIHHDPQYYPDPETFDPERFTEEEKVKRHNCTYLPFGEGPRNCIGMRFGLLQSKSGLVHLLSKFQFDPTEKTPIPMVFDPTATLLQPKGGMFLKVTALS